MIRFPNAKINLGLNIVNRRPDGYHDIETVFYPIALEDSLEIVPAADGCTTSLTCHGRKVDCPMEKNLVTKAFRLLQAEFALPDVEMHLLKHIPDGAGLGGGSSDASSALILLNEMFNLRLSDDQLAERAARLGADCAFFIYNRPLMATGIGNIFSPVEIDLKGYYLFLVKPTVSVPTAAAYAQVHPAPSETAIPDILARPVHEWKGLLKNDFEPSVFAQYPVLGEIKEEIYRHGALYASMSGSGSSMFGIFADDTQAEVLRALYPDYDSYFIAL